MTDELQTKVTTPEFRVAFAHVFHPQEPMQQGGKRKYGVTMLFKKDEDLKALQRAATNAAIARWGSDKSKWPENMRLPFRDQGEKEFDGFVPGAVFMNATSTMRPGIVDAQLNEIIDEADFYSGCYAKATVNAFAYPKQGAKDLGNRGIGFGLNNLQKTRDGDPLTGRVKPQDDFAPVEGQPMGQDDPEEGSSESSLGLLT